MQTTARIIVSYVNPPADTFAEFMAEQVQPLTIRLGSGDRVALDPGDPDLRTKKRLLWIAQTYDRPIRAVVGEDGILSDVSIPEGTRVVGIERGAEDRVVVRFGKLPLVYQLDGTEPGGERILDLFRWSLQNKTEILVADVPEMQRIEDAHRFPDEEPPPAPAGIPPYAPAFGQEAIERADAIDASARDELFQAITASGCDGTLFRTDCIPFRYPYNGCVARAHRMCEILQTRNFTGGKIWIFAPPGTTLPIHTPNAEGCRVGWHFHVAAFARSVDAAIVVFDPSLNERRVMTEEEWTARMPNAGAVVRYSDASAYELSTEPDTGRPPNVRRDEVASDLAVYRDALERRNTRVGAPPFRCDHDESMSGTR